jgi:hypothetical protein
MFGKYEIILGMQKYFGLSETLDLSHDGCQVGGLEEGPQLRIFSRFTAELNESARLTWACIF